MMNKKVINLVSNFFQKAIELFYPFKCPYCGDIIIGSSTSCENCQNKISKNTEITNIFINNNIKIQCISPLKYTGIVRDAILKFKFREYSSYAKIFANHILSELKNKNLNLDFNVITEVPLAIGQLKNRGYNQSELIAKHLSMALDISHEKLVEKVKNNLQQHDLTKENRIKNVKNVYRARSNAKINGKNIILCDDIITTGNTLKECAKILYENNAKNILCVTIAKS